MIYRCLKGGIDLRFASAIIIIHTSIHLDIELFESKKNMQRSGTEAIRTQIQPSKPKQEINTNICIILGNVPQARQTNIYSNYIFLRISLRYD